MYLSYLLRHHPEDIGLDMDERGWVSVEQLIEKINSGEKYKIDFDTFISWHEQEKLLKVGFDVDESLAGASYQVQLVGVSGKVLASARGKSAAGRNTLALKAPKPGLYLLRVSVAGNHAVRKVAISR